MATDITATSLFSGLDRGLLDDVVLRHDNGVITSIAEGAAPAIVPRSLVLPAFVNAHDHARAPTPAEVFSREFLPPRAERELVYTAN